MPGLAWRLYYADGSTFDSEDGAWADAPHIGAVGLITPDVDVGREFDHGSRGEFFAWEPDGSKPWGYDRVGILRYLWRAHGWPTSTRIADLSLDDWRDAVVKVGCSVDNLMFQSILARMTSDPDFPPKSADTLRERVE